VQAGNAPSAATRLGGPLAVDNQWKALPDEIMYRDYAALYDFTAVTETSWRVRFGVALLWRA
jgi:hypothetical protein